MERVTPEPVEVEVRRRRRKRLLQKRSKEALVDIILRLEARFQRYESAYQSATETKVLKVTEAIAPNLESLSFRKPGASNEFIRLPHNGPNSNSNARDDTNWRLVLISSDKKANPLSLEIYSDVVVGRGLGDKPPDLDLTPLGAETLGVSRRHALIRPSRYSLFLIDLGSKNGTYWNAVRLGAGTAQRLKENDVISFSKLHFQLQLVSRPSDLTG